MNNHTYHIKYPPSMSPTEIMKRRNTPFGILEESVNQYGLVPTIAHLRGLIEETPTQTNNKLAETAKTRVLIALLEAAHAAIALQAIKDGKIPPSLPLD